MLEVLERVAWHEFAEDLPAFSKNFVLTSLNEGSDPVAVMGLLINAPTEGLAAKGGVLSPQDIMPQLLAEFRLLCCTEDEKYKSTRDKLKAESAITASVITTLVTGAIASTIGMAYAFCFPLIAVLLAGTAKMGLAAWCQVTNPEEVPPTPPALNPPTDTK